MAFRLNVITIFLLTIAVLVFSASSNRSENSKSRKKKPSPPRLSANIDENPFLKNRTTTTTTTTTTTAPVDYHRNPFLSATPKPQGQLFGNGSDQQQINFSTTNPFVAEEDHDVTVAVYIHNPFLQPPVVNTPNKLGDLGSTNPPNKLVPSPLDSTTDERISETDGRTKSDIKCQEYARQVSGTTEVLSLVGVNSEVIKLDNDKCRTANRLVIGGTVATPGEFPHMVALGIKNADGSFIMYCGGTLISPEWVLTAAHCTYGPNGSPTSARVGFHNLNDDQFGIAATISKIIRHPTYKPPAMYADIAIVKLEPAVTFNRLIRPACLYQQYDTVPTQAWVSGWGVTEFGGERSDRLQKALLDVVDNIACTIRHNRSRAVPHGITPSMICAGDPRGGWNKDTCQGDSGGPLQVIHPKNLCLFQVIGITSFGEGCAIINSPGVYTRVSHYLNWIEDLVWPDA